MLNPGCKPLHFNLHGVGLKIETDIPEVAQRLRSFLEPFISETPLTPADLCGRLTANVLESSIVTSFKDNAQKLMVYEDLNFYRQDSISLYEDGSSAVVLNREQKYFEGIIHPKTLSNHAFFENTFFAFILWELLSLKNRFLLQASSLRNSNGEVFLFPALSGQGKTTLALCLWAKGYDFLSDDLVLLSDDETVFSFPRDLHIDPRLVDDYPEIGFLKERPPYFHLNPKRALKRNEAEKIFGQTQKCFNRAHYLIFPRIQPIAQTRLQPLKPREALTRLIPPSALILLEEEQATIHLKTLKRLAEETRAYELDLGRDLKENPRQLASWLEDRLTTAPRETHFAATGL